MSETDDQLTRPQVVGMLALGVCLWAIILGVAYALLKNALTGMIVAGAGGLGSFIIVKWRIFIETDRQKNR